MVINEGPFQVSFSLPIDPDVSSYEHRIEDIDYFGSHCQVLNVTIANKQCNRDIPVTLKIIRFPSESEMPITAAQFKELVMRSLLEACNKLTLGTSVYNFSELWMHVSSSRMDRVFKKEYTAAIEGYIVIIESCGGFPLEPVVNSLVINGRKCHELNLTDPLEEFLSP